MGRIYDLFMSKYNYTDFHELNLDWLIVAVKQFEYEMDNFVSINAVKYADPIQWNITKQYEKNTIVIDPVTGTAYISAKPVPAGVALSRTDYWNVVFDLSRFITLAAQNFANTYEELPTTTATMATDEGNWIVWDSTLYVAKNDIHVGDMYVPDGNIEKKTVEDFFNMLAAALNQEIQDRQDADDQIVLDMTDLITSKVGIEAMARQDADDQIVLNLTDLIISKVGIEAQTRSDDDAALSSRIDSLVLEGVYTTPEHFGAVGDGVTDDSAAFQAAVDSGKVVYLKNAYAIDSIQITRDTIIEGAKDSVIYPNCVGNTILFKNVFTASYANLTLKGVNIVGQGRYANTGTERYCLIVSENADNLRLIDCTIDNVGHNYASLTESLNNYIPLWVKAVDVMNVEIDGCTFSRGGSDELMVITPWSLGSPSKPSIKFTNNIFTDCDHGASLNLFAYDVLIDHNEFNNFVYAGSIFNLTGENVMCSNNTFNGCNVGSVFDAVESCWFHAEKFNVLYNNFTGNCDIFAEHVGGYGACIGNIVEANTLFFNEITEYSSSSMAPMLRNTKHRRLGRCIITDNYAKISGGTASVIRCFAANANATGDIPISSYTGQSELIVRDNTFDYTTYFSANNKFFIFTPANVKNVCIENNSISSPNADGLGSTVKYLYNVDNRYLAQGITNLKIINNNAALNGAMTLGVRLFNVLDTNYTPVGTLTHYANTSTVGTVTVGSTKYTTELTIAPTA